MTAGTFAEAKELATKADMLDIRTEFRDLRAEMYAIKADIIKWMVGLLIGQTAMLIAVFAWLK